MVSGCGVKVSQLPEQKYPFVAEMEFLKEVKNIEARAKKKRFKQDKVRSPFYFFLRIKEIEDNGSVVVRFYPDPEPKKKNDKKEKTGPDIPKEAEKKLLVEKRFQFGEKGKYYEYIIFFDLVEGLKPGIYRYAIFINQQLLYEDKLVIE